MGSGLHSVLPELHPWTWVDHLVSGLRPRTKRPIQTRCRAPPLQLNLARDRNSPVHSTKARHHPLTALTICRHTVSGSFTLPGCFSPFLTVLVHYRSLGVFSLGDGPPRFRRNFTCSAVLRIHSRENEVSTTGCYPLRRTFPGRFVYLVPL